MELPIFTSDSPFMSATHKKCLTSYQKKLASVLKSKKYSAPECSIVLPFDEKIAKSVRALVKKKVSKNLKYIFVIGIGGSYLGTKAIYDALRGEFSLGQPKLIFIDTLSSPKLLDLKDFLERDVHDPQEILVNVISKSGTTLETIANFEAFIVALEQLVGDCTSRVVVTTDKNSKLWKAAAKKKYALLEIPENVGGRFSLCSAVGQFPLAAAGIDVTALREGAMTMASHCVNENNNAAVSASRIVAHYQKGIALNNLFLFNPELESLGKWYRQLLAESIGKNGKGIMPIISIGSTDLHSVGQLYFGGPHNIYTTFVYAKQLPTQIRVPIAPKFPGLVAHIETKSFKKLMSALYEGVKAAYTSHAMPFSEVVLSGINEYTLGAFMQWKMMEVMYIGALLNINAFDQPAVEAYKKETRKRLEEKE